MDKKITKKIKELAKSNSVNVEPTFIFDDKNGKKRYVYNYTVSYNNKTYSVWEDWIGNPEDKEDGGEWTDIYDIEEI